MSFQYFNTATCLFAWNARQVNKRLTDRYYWKSQFMLRCCNLTVTKRMRMCGHAAVPKQNSFFKYKKQNFLREAFHSNSNVFICTNVSVINVADVRDENGRYF